MGADSALLQVLPEPAPVLAALRASPEAAVHQGGQHRPVVPFRLNQAVPQRSGIGFTSAD